MDQFSIPLTRSRKLLIFAVLISAGVCFLAYRFTIAESITMTCKFDSTIQSPIVLRTKGVGIKTLKFVQPIIGVKKILLRHNAEWVDWEKFETRLRRSVVTERGGKIEMQSPIYYPRTYDVDLGLNNGTYIVGVTQIADFEFLKFETHFDLDQIVPRNTPFKGTGIDLNQKVQPTIYTKDRPYIVKWRCNRDQFGD